MKNKNIKEYKKNNLTETRTLADDWWRAKICSRVSNEGAFKVKTTWIR